MNEHVLNLNLLIFIAAERYLALGEGGGGKTDYKKKRMHGLIYNTMYFNGLVLL